MREYFELLVALPDDDHEDGGAGTESWTGVLGSDGVSTGEGRRSELTL